VSSPVIAVNALTKRYAARTGTVSGLEEISFSVDEGEGPIWILLSGLRLRELAAD
jgi:hypothetical protein